MANQVSVSMFFTIQDAEIALNLLFLSSMTQGFDLIQGAQDFEGIMTTSMVSCTNCSTTGVVVFVDLKKKRRNVYILVYNRCSLFFFLKFFFFF